MPLFIICYNKKKKSSGNKWSHSFIKKSSSNSLPTFIVNVFESLTSFIHNIENYKFIVNECKLLMVSQGDSSAWSIYMYFSISGPRQWITKLLHLKKIAAKKEIAEEQYCIH